ncbi:hypothetical protein ANO11243_060790 [Dothideomycetidae sp. 11243]|nr:hypothetical protein ANO11243_060790 [fungal sp. No.11243]
MSLDLHSEVDPMAGHSSIASTKTVSIASTTVDRHENNDGSAVDHNSLSRSVSSDTFVTAEEISDASSVSSYSSSDRIDEDDDEPDGTILVGGPERYLSYDDSMNLFRASLAPLSMLVPVAIPMANAALELSERLYAPLIEAQRRKDHKVEVKRRLQPARRITGEEASNNLEARFLVTDPIQVSGRIADHTHLQSQPAVSAPEVACAIGNRKDAVYKPSLPILIPQPNDDWLPLLANAKASKGFDALKIDPGALETLSPVDLSRLAQTIRAESQKRKPRMPWQGQKVEFELRSSERSKAVRLEGDRRSTEAKGEALICDETVIALSLLAEGNLRVYARYVGANATAHVPGLKRLDKKSSWIPFVADRHRRLFTLQTSSFMVASAVVAAQAEVLSGNALFIAAEEAMRCGIAHAASLRCSEFDQVLQLCEDLADVLQYLIADIVQDMRILYQDEPEAVQRKKVLNAVGQVVGIIYSAFRQHSEITDQVTSDNIRLVTGLLQVVVSTALVAPGAVLAVFPPLAPIGAGLTIAAVPLIAAIAPSIRSLVEGVFALRNRRGVLELRTMAIGQKNEFILGLNRKATDGLEGASDVREGFDLTTTMLEGLKYGKKGKRNRDYAMKLAAQEQAQA